jgi:2Fe-2S ferredoxin
MPKITFLPAGTTLDCDDGSTLFEVGRHHGIDIDTSCVGKGTCGLCRVKIVDGAEHLNDYTDKEVSHLGNVYFITKVRLSCRTHVSGGDVTVELVPKRKTKKTR